jgi:hypothetical protein
MRPYLCLAFLLAFASSAAATAAPEAAFLGDAVYTTAADCPKHRKVLSGGPRGPATDPTVLTAKGYASWQSSCAFVNIDERYKGRIWTVSLSCRADGVESLRTEVWRRQPDGELTITVNKTSTIYAACIAAPAAAVKKK